MSRETNCDQAHFADPKQHSRSSSSAVAKQANHVSKYAKHLIYLIVATPGAMAAPAARPITHPSQMWALGPVTAGAARALSFKIEQQRASKIAAAAENKAEKERRKTSKREAARQLACAMYKKLKTGAVINDLTVPQLQAIVDDCGVPVDKKTPGTGKERLRKHCTEDAAVVAWLGARIAEA